jgi:hypothetical protein
VVVGGEVVVVELSGGVEVAVVVVDDPDVDVDVVDESGNVVSVDDVVVRSGLSTLPGNVLGSTKDPTSVPLVMRLMYLFHMVAGNVPPNTTRPCTFVMKRSVSSGPFR